MRNVECIITPVTIVLLLLLLLRLRLQCVAVYGCIEMRALFCDIPICETCYLYCRAHFIYKQLTHQRITFICLLSCHALIYTYSMSLLSFSPFPHFGSPFFRSDKKNLGAQILGEIHTSILREFCVSMLTYCSTIRYSF